MERKQVITRLGTGTRVLIVRPLRPWARSTGEVRMCLQVRRGRRWRTIAFTLVPPAKATEYYAHEWILHYEECPDQFQNRFKGFFA